MFDVRPNRELPGFRVRQPEDIPGFHDWRPEGTPGFRVADDGSSQAAFSGPASFGVYGNTAPFTYAPHSGVYPASDRAHDLLKGNPFFDPARGPSAGSGVVYVNAGSDQPGFFGRLRPYLDDVGDAAGKVGVRANAVVNGAYSVFPGMYNALRAVGRGVGLLGPEEFRRFGQEADFIGSSVGQIARHPEAAARAAWNTLSALRRDPLFDYYMGGRLIMGTLLRPLGYAASAGDTLRAVENGHNLVDAWVHGGVGGLPSTRP